MRNLATFRLGDRQLGDDRQLRAILAWLARRGIGPQAVVSLGNLIGPYGDSRRCLELARDFAVCLQGPLERALSGWGLLLWPVLWALWTAAEGLPSLKLLLIFVLGTVLMRSAGCVINDFADRNVDPHVARTRERPLAARRVVVATGGKSIPKMGATGLGYRIKHGPCLAHIARERLFTHDVLTGPGSGDDDLFVQIVRHAHRDAVNVVAFEQFAIILVSVGDTVTLSERFRLACSR